MGKSIFVSNLIVSLLLSYVLPGQHLPHGNVPTTRKSIILNNNWQFHLEKNQGASKELNFEKASWQPVVLPHTLQLTSLDLDGVKDDSFQKTFHRYVGWYRRTLKTEATKGQRVFLEFEGAHQVTNLWVNGKHVGEHAIGGYTPFHFDITEFVEFEGKENTILISTDNRINENVPPEGSQYDYIKFGGLYRDVYLVTTDPLYITFPWENNHAGVFITTPTVTKENATINIRTTVRNTSELPEKCRLLTRIIDQAGRVVCRMSDTVAIQPDMEFTFSQTGGINKDLHLWSIETPYLYKVHTLVFRGNQAVDVVENPLGIRKFEFIKDKGFLLNGKSVELIGANRHQAYPYIGDAVPNSLHWKDAWQLKQAGFNVVRLAHYPHDNSFIEACDRLGILIYEEPPTWIGIGNETWMNNLEEAIRRMIRNHRNHPSILMWGAGINHRGPVERLHYASKEEDPGRVTASNGSPWTGPRNSGVCDIYAPMDYQNMPLNPHEITFLCEHGSSADASRNQFEVSKARALANHIGVAVWTAHDYQSFKPNRGLYPRRPLSIFRVPNPVYYWYQSELLPGPVVYVADERASEVGEVLVFSNCQEVALYHNGKFVARQGPDYLPQQLHVDHPSFLFAYEWNSGELKAECLLDGEVVAAHSLRKGGQPHHLEVTIESDNAPFYANNSDMKLARAYIVDKNGHTITTDTSEVKFMLNGAGSIVGGADIGANPVKAHYGVASVLVRAGENPGKIQLSASAKGLNPGSASIETTYFNENRTIALAGPIYDFEPVRIDLGGTKERLLQFGWLEWPGHENSIAVNTSENQNKIELKLQPVNGKMTWFEGWGLSANLAYVGVDGVKTDASAQLALTINGLEPGSYTLTTYHHLIDGQEDSDNEIQVLVNDAGRKNDLMKVPPPSFGIKLGNKYPVSNEIVILSDGADPVMLTFKNLSETSGVVLNGIEIEKWVPDQ